MGKKKPHGNHEKSCTICAMSADTIEEIRFLYVNWYNQKQLISKYKISLQALLRHARQTGWYEERLSNTKARYADIASKEPEDWKGSDINRALENIDEQQGNVEDSRDELQKTIDSLQLTQINQMLKELKESKDK